MTKLRLSLIALGLTASSAAMANSAYINHNLETHATEIGATIAVNDAFMYVGADDQDWRAVGMGYTAHMNDRFAITTYAEYGVFNGAVGMTNTEFLADFIMDYSFDSFGISAGAGYSNSGLASMRTETWKTYLGADTTILGFDVAYNFTYHIDEFSALATKLDSDSLAENEIVVSRSFGNVTPYVSYTTYDADYNDEVSVGMAFSF